MLTEANSHFFLGANTPVGFYSLYDEIYFPDANGMLYIIKGGPGCGKSSLMKTVASKLSQDGYCIEYIHCSGDPNSLDGIIVPALGVAIADGTAPHVIEPRYPALSELYINLGEFYDETEIGKKQAELLRISKQHKSCCSRAYRLLAAAGNLTEDLLSTAETEQFLQKMQKRSRGIILREFPKQKGSEGRVYHRFLSTISCEGEITYWDTVTEKYSRVYELCDGFGLAHRLIEPIAAAAVNNGLDIVLCHSSLSPDRYEHLLIPSLNLAFISSSPRQPFPGTPYRRLRLENASETTKTPWVRTLAKYIRFLTRDAVAVLSQAKALHDEMEDLYNPHVDFDGVYAKAQALAGQLSDKK